MGSGGDGGGSDGANGGVGDGGDGGVGDGGAGGGGVGGGRPCFSVQPSCTCNGVTCVVVASADGSMACSAVLRDGNVSLSTVLP